MGLSRASPASHGMHLSKFAGKRAFFSQIPVWNWLYAPFQEALGHICIQARGPKATGLGKAVLKHEHCWSFPEKKCFFIKFAPSLAPFTYGFSPMHQRAWDKQDLATMSPLLPCDRGPQGRRMHRSIFPLPRNGGREKAENKQI